MAKRYIEIKDHKNLKLVQKLSHVISLLLCDVWVWNKLWPTDKKKQCNNETEKEDKKRMRWRMIN